MKEENNFTHVLEYLLDHDMIRNQKDLAKRLNTTETTITRNKKGNVKHLDEETLHRFNMVFGDIINIGFLRGESDVMLIADLQQKNEIYTDVNPCKKGCPADCSSLIRETIAAKNEAITALKHEIAAKDEIIAANNILINSLQQQVLKLQGLCDTKKEDTHECQHIETADEERTEQ